MTLDMAVGGDETLWVWLALEGGRTAWIRLVDPDEPVRLQDLFAQSPLGTLLHPTDVPIADRTTLAELEAMLAGELGPEARVEDIRLDLGRGVTLLSHGERSVRLEAPGADAIASRLARLGDVPAERWSRILHALREELLTGRYLRVAPGDGSTEVSAFASEAALVRGEPEERIRLAA